MHVGIMKIYIKLENSSLKGKRQLIRPVISQIRNRYNVSAAEVEQQDNCTRAVIGVSLVSSDIRIVYEMLSNINNFVDSGRFSVEVMDSQIEVMPV